MVDCGAPCCIQKLYYWSVVYGKPDCQNKEGRPTIKYQSMLKFKEEYDNLLAEVNNIKELNKALEHWSVSQLHTMVKLYKHDEDNAMPGKKADVLTRYQEICNQGDQVAPPLPKMPLLPHAVQQLPDLSPNEDLLLDDVSIEELLAFTV